MSKIIDIATNAVPYIHNPSLMIDNVINTVKEGGVELVDPTNPVVMAIENAVMLTMASGEHHESTLRRVYARMATSYEELYPHMCDKDFLDRFSKPAPKNLTLMLGVNELKEKAIPPDSMGVRKLVIPRDTSIRVGELTFTLQYPIELRILPHGGIQVVYDTSETSPVTTLSSNTLPWGIVAFPYDGSTVEMLVITLSTLQYSIVKMVDNVIPGTTFNNTYSFADKFFYARVYTRVGGMWNEIDTTHAERNIDPLKPMAQFKVNDLNELNVQIPDVYIRSGQVSGDIRIDIYTTKGKVSMDMGQYLESDYQYKMVDLNETLDKAYYSPLSKFTHLKIIGDGMVDGGVGELPFLELRDRIIDNAIGSRKVPVSEKQLFSDGADRGYDISLSIDYVTKRIYKASKEMLPSTIKEVSSPIGTLNGILETSKDELSQLDTIFENGNRFTLTPDTLYRYHDGMLVLEPLSIPRLSEMQRNSLVSLVNGNTYLFTPFHYVLDFNDGIDELRPYYLDSPAVANKRFVETNISLGLDVGILSYSVKKTSFGYTLAIITRSGETYKTLPDDNVHVQLSFIPRGYSSDYAYVDGTFVGWDTESDERIFEFRIETSLDIDRNDDLIVNNFTLLGSYPTPTPLQLTATMNVMFGVSKYDPPEFKTSTIDKIYVSDNRGLKGITHETVELKLGDALGNGIWKNLRDVAGSKMFARYSADVMKYYESDVIARDANGVKYTIDSSGEVPVIDWEYDHRKGDPVMIDGKHVVLHEKDSIMLLPNGEPVIENPRGIRYRLDMFVLDAKYRISNTDETKSYLDGVISTLLNSILVDIPQLQQPLLEQTEITLYPRSTIGLIKVLLADGTTTLINAEQQFNFSYYLTQAARRNDDLLKTLKQLSRTTSVKYLNQRTVSIVDIMEDIKNIMGDEIIDVSMEQLGADKDQPIFTVYDNSDKPALGKKLTIEPDGKLAIRDDLNVGYHRHQLDI